MKSIPFTRPTLAGTEVGYVREAAERGELRSGGEFTQRCERWLESHTGAAQARLSHSGTGALEAAMILTELRPGDEVIMPSFGYPTMATAALRQGATPVFVDVEAATLNVDPELVAAAVGPRTRVIVAVHYGGIGCEMDALGEIVAAGQLSLIEDAAHCLLASRDGRQLGAIGDVGTYSFHHTKNVTSGEGGALLINRPRLRERAEPIWEKGTDRARFERGEVDRYAWVDVGSSFAASELTAAFLWGQLEIAEELTARRRAIWGRYHEAFAELEAEELVRRPTVPPGCEHNGHLYYLVLPTASGRDAFIAELAAAEIACVFHYVPLHDSPGGRLHGRVAGSMERTEELSERLVRLPLWADLDEGPQQRVIETVIAAVRRLAGSRAG